MFEKLFMNALSLLFSMFGLQCVLPLKLLLLELDRRGKTKEYYRYCRRYEKLQGNIIRVEFLRSCYFNHVIRKFLKICIPTNGCFNDIAVKNFQRKMLKL